MGFARPFLIKIKMAKTETTKVTKTKVKALESLAQYGYAYSEGDVFEIDSKIAEEWIKILAVDKV